MNHTLHTLSLPRLISFILNCLAVYSSVILIVWYLEFNIAWVL
ncbi:hypothetical protein MtrunA17_Chr4g0047291 [Medicago truncatula]|uniref:Transmembrane protein n=1 Tax=Medicago truncatula TaxID=3880 RepID=A0A396IHQ9_MEDTR|nr:hypothetical protein MtrunA17_Chr4g0047291 [Medicago truncatula]